MPPPRPASLYTGTPMEESASMSRKIVRIDTSRRCASSPAVSGWPRCRAIKTEMSRCARTLSQHPCSHEGRHVVRLAATNGLVGFVAAVDMRDLDLVLGRARGVLVGEKVVAQALDDRGRALRDVGQLTVQ